MCMRRRRRGQAREAPRCFPEFTTTMTIDQYGTELSRPPAYLFTAVCAWHGMTGPGEQVHEAPDIHDA